MPDRTAAGPADPAALIREAVSVHTRKIFDSCRDKDCVDDLRVFPTLSSQSYIDSALSLRPRSAELLYIDVSVEPISFNRGYYTVDCTHFYRVTGETFPGGDTLQGLAIFEKRAAAEALGVPMIVLRRPEDQGESFEAVLAACLERMKEFT